MKGRRKKGKAGGPPQAHPNPNPVAPRLTGWRVWRWRLVSVVVVPLVFLAIIELVLRVAGFGYPTSFLLTSANHGRATFVQNNQFGWRFFGKRMARTPSAISILQEKPRDTVRIFVFGESAAFGDPQPAFGLPRVLEATLTLRHPGVKFEVVNAAMTAISSHVIVPIARDCARAGGDIWVIYMGNNEVVGPFGAGTVFGAQAPPLPFVRASLALKGTRLGQLLDGARQLWQKPPLAKSEWGGMEMFLDQQVRADDPRMANVYRNFAGNLADIIRAGHESGAGVVVSTVAVNTIDCAPFASEHRPGLSELDRQKSDDFCKLGVQAQAAGRMSDALALFQEAARLDDSSAELQFCLGRCLLALGDAAGARKSLGAARDLDTLRFRCDSRLNELARKAAAGREGDRILLADAEQAFAAASPDGLPGWNLFYEHVHLTFEGNCLLARTLAEQIEKLLPPNMTAPSAAWPTVADCARRLGRTGRDLQSALTELLSRLTDPPFTAQLNHDEQVRDFTVAARRLAETNAATGPAYALKVARDALAASPDDAQLHEKVAELEQAAGHLSEAEEAARRGVDLLPSDSEAWSQLGMILVEEKKFEDAVNAFRSAYDLNSQDVWPLQNLAMALGKLGRKEEAMREYRRALAITPRFGLAWLGLGQLLEGMGRTNEAAACFTNGLRNPIHRAPELTTLAKFCMSRGWYEAASTNYSAAAKLDPADRTLSLEAGEAHFMYGMELGKSGKSAQATREFRTAVGLMPEVVEARLNLGIALFQDGQREEALSEFEEVVARNPANALARHYIELLRGKPGPAESR